MPKHPKRIDRRLPILGMQAALALLCATLPPSATAQAIFKCGKTYTNVPSDSETSQARQHGCVLVDPATAPKAGATPTLALDGSRQIVVPVGKDGRFWVRGSVNGFPVQFLIDKSATASAGVAVSEEFAARANLIGGMPSSMRSAAGIVDARRIEHVPVTFGPFKVPKATVVVGPLGVKSTDAVLGQELLSHFAVTANDREMTIVSK
jgi:predicted aspartyl protease